MSVTLNTAELKQQVKDALSELLIEHREELYDLMVETFEELALIKATQEGVTIEIPTALYDEVHHVAKMENTTVKALVEEVLRRIVIAHKQRAPFVLRNASFKGNGLQSAFSEPGTPLYERRSGRWSEDWQP